MRIPVLALMLVVIAFSVQAKGQSGAASGIDACFALETTMATQDCLVGETDKADTQLNAAYQAVIAEARQINKDMEGEMGADKVEENIRIAQRAWNDWRSKECFARAEFENTGGSIRGLNKQVCDLNLLTDRVKVLQDLVKPQDQ